MTPQRVAIAHEWLQSVGGSEQVFAALAAVYPDADLYALSIDPTVEPVLHGRTIRTTWLDHGPTRRRRNITLPLMPLAWRTLRAPQYDAVITSHHAFAHCNQLARNGVHLCYVHSPARYVWTPQIDARGAGRHLAPARALLKRVDRRAARRVTAYAANSSAVASRISEFWDRSAVVIPPPVRVEFFSDPPICSLPPSRNYLLGVGRWVPYKNLHMVIQVGSLVGIPVKIAGSGPERSRLEAEARRSRVPVDLIESPSDSELRKLYRDAAALIFPTIEDFGIVPVEAQAAGTPVIAPAIGGALDTIIDAESGILTSELTVEAIAEAVPKAMDLVSDACRANASRFSMKHFVTRVLEWANVNGLPPIQRIT